MNSLTVSFRRGGLRVSWRRAVLESTAETVLRTCEGLVVIDEVQRMPHLFELRSHRRDIRSVRWTYSL